MIVLLKRNARIEAALDEVLETTQTPASASERSHSSIWPSSVRSARRNLRRAGTFANSASATTRVPGGSAAGPSSTTAP